MTRSYFGFLLWGLLLLMAGCDSTDPEDMMEAPPESDPPIRNAQSLVEPTGPYTIGTAVFEMTDMPRTLQYDQDPETGRRVMVQLWYPTDLTVSDVDTTDASIWDAYMHPDVISLFSTFQDYTDRQTMLDFMGPLLSNSLPNAPVSNAQAQFPVVFYSHGLGGVRSLYTTYLEELASQGYIVVGIDHTFGAFATAFTDGTLSLLSFTPPPFSDVVQIWAEDMAFVLDELTQINQTDVRFMGCMDLDKIGVMGHSTGGSAAAQVLTMDARFKAGISLDSPQVGDATTTGINQPFMLMFAEPSDYFGTAVQDQLKSQGYTVTIANTTHYNFTDLPLLLQRGNISSGDAQASSRPPGNLDPHRNLEIQNVYTLAFFERHLLGENPQLLVDGGGTDFPEVDFEIVTAATGSAYKTAAPSLNIPDVQPILNVH